MAFTISFQFHLNLVTVIFNFDLVIKLYVKTRLVTNICKKLDLTSTHDLYTS